jgi:hypothetical protein
MLGFYYPNSHMWGVLFFHFFKELDIPFCLINDSSLTKLKHIKVLIVPGGFVSVKVKKLKDRGLRLFREYVEGGGIYLGFCGGAGLGLTHGKNTIGLCDAKRKAIAERLPNFSGHVRVGLSSSNDLCKLFKNNEISVPVWWPSQFELSVSENAEVLASYRAPGDDLWITDIPYNILKEMDIREVEKIYGINLNFNIIVKNPCVVFGSHGKGKYLLSYPHLETPASPEANKWLVWILSYFLDKELLYKKIRNFDVKNPFILWDDEHLLLVWNKLLELIAIGQENFLLCWRKKWLLGWRRGVIGLCLNSLLCMVCFLLESDPSFETKEAWKKNRELFLELFKDFYERFKKYLSMQRFFYLKKPNVLLINLKKIPHWISLF